MSTKEFAAETAAVFAVNLAGSVMYGLYKNYREARADRKLAKTLVTD